MVAQVKNNKSLYVKANDMAEALTAQLKSKKAVYLEGDAMIEALEEIANSENQNETVGKIIATLHTNCGNCKLWLKCSQSAYYTDEQERKTCDNWRKK